MSANFYTISLSSLETPATNGELQSRWTEEATNQVRAAILNKKELPRVFPPITVKYLDKTTELEDLRGINLSGIRVKNYDLTFCCFDFANLSKVHFESVLLQYSSFRCANLMHSKLLFIQGSPIDAQAARFNFSNLQGCFFSNSNFQKAHTLFLTVDDCDFSQASNELRSARINRKTITNSRELVEYFTTINASSAKDKILATIVRKKANHQAQAIIRQSNSIKNKTTKQRTTFEIVGLGKVRELIVGDIVEVVENRPSSHKVMTSSWKGNFHGKREKTGWHVKRKFEASE